MSSQLSSQRKLVDAFLAALRAGDFEALVAVLDPDVVVKADLSALPPGAAAATRGAQTCAQQAIRFARGAASARTALVDGSVGVVIAPRGRLFRVIRFTFAGGKIAEIDVVADAARLQALSLAVLQGE